jgi:hypothetical protein
MIGIKRKVMNKVKQIYLIFKDIKEDLKIQEKELLKVMVKIKQ